MPAVQQAREHRTNAKTRGDGLYSMGFSWFDCEPQAHEQLRYKRKTYPLQNDFFTPSHPQRSGLGSGCVHVAFATLVLRLFPRAV